MIRVVPRRLEVPSSSAAYAVRLAGSGGRYAGCSSATRSRSTRIDRPRPIRSVIALIGICSARYSRGSLPVLHGKHPFHPLARLEPESSGRGTKFRCHAGVRYSRAADTSDCFGSVDHEILIGRETALRARVSGGPCNPCTDRGSLVNKVGASFVAVPT
jgi:hypothetical protein